MRMKLLSLAIWLTLLPVLAKADLKAVCQTIIQVNAHDLLYKSDPSNGIQTTDCRTKGYTLVCGKICPSRTKRREVTGFYYSDGIVAGQLGYYGTFAENNQPRAYGCVGGAAPHDATQIAIQANIKPRNGFLYLLMSDKRDGSPGTLCAKVSSTGRTGSVP